MSMRRRKLLILMLCVGFGGIVNAILTRLFDRGHLLAGGIFLVSVQVVGLAIVSTGMIYVNRKRSG